MMQCNTPCNTTSYLPSPDDLTQIAWQVAHSYNLLNVRAPCVYQQVIPVGGPPGRIYQAFRQLPAQNPDVIQRVYVVQPGRDVIDLVIQGAQAQAPVYQDQTVWQPTQPPTVYPRVIQPQQLNFSTSTPVVAPVMPTMAAFPVASTCMPVQTPIMYGGYAMPSFIANTSQFPVAYGTRTFPRTYFGRSPGMRRGGSPFFY